MMSDFKYLKDCPFCGGSTWMLNVEGDTWVFCHGSADRENNKRCILDDTDIEDLTVFSEDLDDFIAAWNRRADG